MIVMLVTDPPRAYLVNLLAFYFYSILFKLGSNTFQVYQCIVTFRLTFYVSNKYVWCHVVGIIGALIFVCMMYTARST